MADITATSELPNLPAIYAMYGGQGRSRYVAYVGLATKLKSRVEQHLVRRDSSVTTGVSAVSLNPEYVTEVRW
jgi:excinuclease UvrABC nuclease subunit